MQTIITKYIPASSTRGSRIKAKQSGGGLYVTIPYPHELNEEDAHWKAAAHLVKTKLPNWSSEYVQGSLENGYVFVFASDTKRKIT